MVPKNASFLSANVEEAGDYRKVATSCRDLEIRVFHWKKHISASKYATQYYKNNVVFHPVYENIQPIPKEEKRYGGLDHIECHAVPLHSLVGDLAVQVQSTSSVEAVRNHIQKEGIFLISLIEVQVSDMYRAYLAHHFPEFLVSREDEDTMGASNMFSPFHQSRRDLSIVRRGENINTAGVIQFQSEPEQVDGENSIDVSQMMDGLTIEGKMSMKDNDRYQLLALMEITASEVAFCKLHSGEIFTTIKVAGALVDYRKKTGLFCQLIMNFSAKKSIISISQEVSGISQVMYTLFSKI